MILTILTIFAAVVFLQSVVSGVRIIATGRSFFKHFTRLQKSPAPAPDLFPNICIFLPVLREEKTIAAALQIFSQIRYPKEKLKIVVVTTEREFENGHIHPNSIEETRIELPKLNAACGHEKFLHIHYPFRTGVKSDQLNYALMELEHLFPTFFDEKTYIGVYDIDSTIPADTLALLASDAIQNDFPNVYQQPSLYFKNFDVHENGIRGSLAHSFSFLQTTYASSYENYNFLKQSELIKKDAFFFRYTMRYCIGHGLFVRRDYLKRLGSFPTPIEDTRLGHVISYLKEDIRLLPIFDTVGVAQGVWESIRQASVWFWGEVLFVEDIKIARRVGQVNPLFGCWLMAYKAYRNTLWIFKGPVFALVFLWTLATGHFLLASMTLFSIFIPIIFFHSKMRLWETMAEKRFYKFKTKDLTLIIFIPLELILMSMGPLLGFFKFFIWRITKRLPKTYRTEK